MTRHDLILRNVRPMGGAAVDVAIGGGRIMAIGERLAAKGPELDGGGRALIPGLIDHHIHLFATAAKLASVDLEGLRDEGSVVQRLRAAPPGWVRAIGYDDAVAGLPDRNRLDQWVLDRPLRMQDRTGALWMLNSLGVSALGDGPFPHGVSLDSDGQPTGHVWRKDAWLRDRLGSEPPSLVALGEDLARLGVTGVTDASANNGPSEAAFLAQAGLPQELMVMGREDLPPSQSAARGPVKLLFDERDLPDIDSIAARITIARAQGRAVAAHCVTAGELLFYLAALDAAGGARPGDRIEHGADIPASLLGDIASLGLTVVTQPGFIHGRGDRYARDLDQQAQADLWRLRSLLDAGIKTAAGSDAPYGPYDPWLAIRTATRRRTMGGKVIGAQECVSARQALNLYLGSFDNPGGPPRQIVPGAPANLCLFQTSLTECLTDPHRDMVQATLIAGTLFPAQ